MHRAFGIPGGIEPAVWVAAGILAVVLVSRQGAGKIAGSSVYGTGPLIAAPMVFPTTIDPTTGGPVVTEIPPSTFTNTPPGGAIDPITGLALDPRLPVQFP